MSSPSMGRHRVPAVLVVDDNETVRQLARRALEGEGYQVWEAGDGLQALGWLTRGVVDLVVTDIRMPAMDGWELAAHLRSMTHPPAILFMSGYDAHVGLRNVPGPVLPKPFTPEQLVMSVRQLLLGPQPQSA
jgi:CheY-like chemotaxis protein